MTQEKQLELFDSYTAHLRQLIISKGADYAKSEDKLSNFKEVGAMTHQTRFMPALNLIATKVARLSTLLADTGKKPNHESVIDSCLDGANYFFLLAQLFHEAEEEKVTEVWAPVEEYNMLREISKDPAPDFMETYDDEGRLVRVRRKY